MRFEVLRTNLEKLIKQRNISSIFATIMLVTNLILVSSFILKDEKIVIIPANLKQTVWLSSDEVSKEYLEEWAVFIASLILDVSSDSAEFKRQVLLRHISSNYKNQLSKELIQNQQKMLQEQFSTSFRPIEAEVSPRELTVVIKGDLITFVGSKNIKQERTNYLMKFDYSLGNLILKSFKSEVKE